MLADVAYPYQHLGFPMKISYSHELDDARNQISIGQIRAATGWRAADRPIDDADRQIALRELIAEAEDFAATGVVDVSFSAETVYGPDIGAAPLRRVTATGLAVRFKLAA
jgi:hypothetical protein